MAEITGLVNAFSENSSDTQRERFAEELMKILEELQNTAFDKGKDDIQLAKINSCAIALWNASVAMKNGRKTNITVNAQGLYSLVDILLYNYIGLIEKEKIEDPRKAGLLGPQRAFLLRTLKKLLRRGSFLRRQVKGKEFAIRLYQCTIKREACILKVVLSQFYACNSLEI